jgi:uncharacterized protein YndB with AHSA1/START domain
MPVDESPVGKTRDTGWQMGVSKTFAIAVEEAWAVLLSPLGTTAWLGEGVGLAKDAHFTLEDGTRCRVTTFRPDSHLRMAWQPPDYPRAAVLQLRVTPKPSGTTVAFMQQHLPNEAARMSRLAYFQGVMKRVADLF